MSAMPSGWNKLRQLRCFPNDRKALSLLDVYAFFAAFRFSARVWSPGRGAQTSQQFVHPASHLLRRRHTMFAFPRTQFCFDQIASQHQMIVRTGNNMAPTLKLLWGPQTRGFPQQRLFVKAIAMFLPETQHIAQSDLDHIGFLIPYPDKPAHPWIALFVGGMRSHDPQNGHFQPASLFDMHALPTADFHRTTFRIGAFPHAIWLTMRCRSFRLHSGRLCTCCAVLSAEVTASGRAILLASIPIQSHFPGSGLGR